MTSISFLPRLTHVWHYPCFKTNKQAQSMGQCSSNRSLVLLSYFRTGHENRSNKTKDVQHASKTRYMTKPLEAFVSYLDITAPIWFVPGPHTSTPSSNWIENASPVADGEHGWPRISLKKVDSLFLQHLILNILNIPISSYIPQSSGILLQILVKNHPLTKHSPVSWYRRRFTCGVSHELFLHQASDRDEGCQEPSIDDWFEQERNACEGTTHVFPRS
jgi:hypothetical protein